MLNILYFLNILILVGSALFFLVLGISSYIEKEFRAVIISFISLVFNCLVWFHFIYWAESQFNQILNIILLSGIALFGIISLLRFFPEKQSDRTISKALQYDERDNMFARNNIQYYPNIMKKYYEMRPENESTDKQIHQKPEFGSQQQLFYDDCTSPCFMAAFEYLEKTIPASTGTPAEVKKKIDPEKFCAVIKEIVEFYGGCDTGFKKLEPYHFYSHRGRHAPHWGQRTDQDHKTAISIIVPMRVEMLKKAPSISVLQESAQKYVEAAKISNILAGYIRSFGYSARAHNDANYDTLCVPLAVESGCGELGRMGILMHRVHGPCVRIAVVTTELDLPESKRNSNKSYDQSMENFCKICKKCADNCPSGSISNGNEPESRGFRHWSIDQEKCFSYWKTIGSDCGLCISVCPYTKPDTIFHRFIRFYISRNSLNQKIALFMDDLLYGRNLEIAKKNPRKIFLD